MSKKQDKPETSASRQEVVAAKVSNAYATARDKASGAVHDAASGIEANPLAALLGGVALGAAAGVLLPRGDRERALLAPLGERLATAVREAIAAGRGAGQEALDGSSLSVDNLRDLVGKLIGQTTQAAGAAGLAAFQEGRDRGG